MLFALFKIILVFIQFEGTNFKPRPGHFKCKAVYIYADGAEYMICTLTLVVYSLTSLLLCLYIGRIQASFPPISLCLRLLSFLHLPFLLTLLGLTTACTGLEVWGAILLALWLSASCLDLCLTQRVGRRGKVLTLGDSAGCIEEEGTRRQFVAPFKVFGALRVGQRVSFQVDWERYHGVHKVGGTTYRRYECRPVGYK